MGSGNDREAFLELIRRHGDKAYNFAYRLAGNEADARDLVQEALARAFEHRGRYDASKPFDSWLLKIMQNVYLDGVRRQARRPELSLDAPPPSLEGVWEELLPGGDGPLDEKMLRGETDALVQKALDGLPIHYRTAVLLSDVEGLSYERISAVMACPIGTVRSRIHQGRVLLRKAVLSLQSGRNLQ